MRIVGDNKGLRVYLRISEVKNGQKMGNNFCCNYIFSIFQVFFEYRGTF